MFLIFKVNTFLRIIILRFMLMILILLTGSIPTTRKNIEALVIASKEICLEVNAEKSYKFEYKYKVWEKNS
jgi:hypothetical protein